MIQTGHSNGAATVDEQKVIANALWFLSQFTTDTTGNICSARDIDAPDTITVIRQSCNEINILSKDKGSSYRFYVKARNEADYDDTCESNILDAVVKSGLRGFYVSEDNNAGGVPDTSVAQVNTTFIDAIDSQLVVYTVLDTTNFIHIQAIDSAGNLSAVLTFKITALAVVPSVSILASDTNICSGVTVTFTATDDCPIFTYQWVKNGVDIVGATQPTYTCQPANADVITCRITSGTQSVVSNAITMNVGTVYPLAADISAHRQTVCIGDSLTFTSAGAGNGIWSLSNGNAIITGSNTGASVTIQGIAVGKVFVSYMEDIGGCQTKSTSLLKVIDTTAPEIRIGFER
jgi:hypothetical protein